MAAARGREARHLSEKDAHAALRSLQMLPYQSKEWYHAFDQFRARIPFEPRRFGAGATAASAEGVAEEPASAQPEEEAVSHSSGHSAALSDQVQGNSAAAAGPTGASADGAGLRFPCSHCNRDVHVRPVCCDCYRARMGAVEVEERKWAHDASQTPVFRCKFELLARIAALEARLEAQEVLYSELVPVHAGFAGTTQRMQDIFQGMQEQCKDFESLYSRASSAVELQLEEAHKQIATLKAELVKATTCPPAAPSLAQAKANETPPRPKTPKAKAASAQKRSSFADSDDSRSPSQVKKPRGSNDSPTSTEGRRVSSRPRNLSLTGMESLVYRLEQDEPL
eukprot:m.22486 g.22486  ORF g.22486 m.22486 type:complete len:338 (-) comp4008_c0_seq1:150-1163(-)